MASKKRASGEGTIRKRSNVLWEARLSIPGQYKTKSFYGKTQADARRKPTPGASARRPGRLWRPGIPSTRRGRPSASTWKDGSKAP